MAAHFTDAMYYLFPSIKQRHLLCQQLLFLLSILLSTSRCSCTETKDSSPTAGPPPPLPIYLSLEELDSFEIVPQGSSTLAFVFDVTGSMYDDLVQVIDGAAKIVETILERKEKIIHNYVLVPFHDPEIGPITETTDSDEFLKQLQNLRVRGGGDCPEMSVEAIKHALNLSLPKSFIYVFTDASSKDYYQLEKVLSLIQKKESQVVFVLTGDCGDPNHPGYQAYEKIASTSSGQIFNLTKDDVDEVLNFVRVSLQANKVNLLAEDHFEAGNHSVEITVDPNLVEFTLSVSGDNPKIQLVNPQGQVTQDKAVTNLLSLKNVEIINIKKPVPGKWMVVVTSNSSHSIRLTGLSNIDFVHGFSLQPTLHFQETYHRPLKGATTHLILNSTDLLDGYLDKVQLVDLRGNIVVESLLTPVAGSKGLYVASTFVPPDGFFYLQVSGTDDEGYSFKRISSTAISAIQPNIPDIEMRLISYSYRNEPVKIVCKIESLLPIRGQMFRGRAASVPVTQQYHFNQSNEIEFHIAKATEKDEDFYWCSASNIAGTNSKSLFLNVKDPPPIVFKPDNVTAILGEKNVLKCTVDAFGSFNVTWSRLVHVNNKYRFVSDPITNNPRALNQENGYLFLLDTKKDDAGWYRCIATNEGGTTYQQLYVTVKAKPEIDVSSINTQPEVIQGYPLKLSCPTSGDLHIDFKWFKDGKELKSQSNPSEFVIDKVTRADEGRYSCLATNSAGNSRVDFDVKVLSPPQIVSSDTTNKMKATQNDQVIFRCEVTGTPTPIFSWLKDGHVVDPVQSNFLILVDSKSSELLIPNVKLSDEGRYTCIARNRIGVAEKDFQFQVIAPPYFGEGSQKIVVKNTTLIHEPFSLDCLVSGSPVPKIVWLKNDQRILPMKDVKIINNGQTLHIPKALESHGGEYTCSAGNEAGISSKTFRVEILVPPTIFGIKDVYYAKEKESLSISCRYKGNPVPEITWKKTTDGRKLSDQQIVIRNADFHIENIRENHNGIYACIATNVVGEDQRTFEINVLVPPQLDPPYVKDHSVMENEPVTLICPVRGNPIPDIVWLKSGKMIADVQTKINGRKLTLTQLDENNNLSCTATNQVGEISFYFTVQVQFAPKIELNAAVKTDIKVIENDTALLECPATGTPKPFITWLKNGKIFTGAPKSRVEVLENGQKVNFKSIRLSDSGKYTCIAGNKLGISEVDFNMQVQVSPQVARNARIDRKHEVFENRQVLLNCPLFGVPNPTITWLKNRVPVDSTSDPRFSINGKTLQIFLANGMDTARYTCVATNEAGRNEIEFDVTVLIPPQLYYVDEEMEYTDGKRDVIAIANKSAKLECFMDTGYPSADIMWLKKGRPVHLVDRRLNFLSNRQVLHIDNTTESDAGFYTCVASNLAGTTEANFELHVMIPPTIIQKTSEENAVKTLWNKPTVLDCAVHGIPEPFITWFKDGEPISSSISSFVSIQLGGQKLHIHQTQIEDAGNLSCVAENDIGQVEKITQLIVLVPPTIEKFEQMQSVIGNEEINLHCNATGIPFPQVFWLKDEQLIDETLQNELGIKLNRGNQHLQIDHAKPDNGGEYSCVVHNEVGSTEMDILLQVIMPPAMTSLNKNENFQVFISRPLTLECPVTANPKPDIEWFKDGTSIVSTNSKLVEISQEGHILRFFRIQEKDSGNYTCFATNAAGESQMSFLIDVWVPPHIEAEFSRIRRKVLEGESIHFECFVTGNPFPIIEWTKDNRLVNYNVTGNIDIRNEGQVLRIKVAKQSDKGIYRCHASSVAGNSETSFDLLVFVPAKIVGFPASGNGTSVNVNDKLTVECEAQGLPQPIVTWFQNGQPIEVYNSKYKVTENGHFLHIDKVAESDAQIYSCLAVNTFGQDEKHFKLSVNTPALIDHSEIKEKVTVVENETVTLQCPATGSPQPNITWIRNGDKLKARLNGRLSFLEGGQSLKILNVTFDDSGDYHCEAVNEVSSDEIIINLSVLKPPVIIGENWMRVTLNIGQLMRLSCSAVGFPLPQMKWFHNNIPMDYRNPRIDFDADWTLQVTHVMIEDAGKYSCTAENSVGRSQLDYVVEVQKPPQFTILPGFTEAFIGENVSLSCAADGIPPPLISWTHNGIQLNVNQTNVSLLQVIDVQKLDAGVYQCTAKNAAGEKHAMATVLIKGPAMISDYSDEIASNNPNETVFECVYEDDSYLFRSEQDDYQDYQQGRLFWHYNFFNIQNDSIDDLSRYVCLPRSYSNTAEQVIHLKVMKEPTFLVEPFDVVTNEGETAIFHCQADGTPSPILQWYRGKTKLQTRDKYSILSNNSLMIDDVQLSDEDKYSCLLTNEVGSTLIEVQLRVLTNGGWTEWSGWSSCSVSCGNGVYERFRTCNSLSPDTSDEVCDGPNTETKICNRDKCPVNGEWSKWTEWEPCSSNCNTGQRRRFRKCNNPLPQYGGRLCVGSNEQMQLCNTHSCSQAVQWSSWSEWTECSVTCGRGKKQRNRHCSISDPKKSALWCKGKSSDQEECGQRLCIEKPNSAVGKLLGLVNGVDLGISTLTANFSESQTERVVTAVLENVQPETASWFRSLMAVLSPIYWTTAQELDGSANGFTLTRGHFTRDTEVTFLTGEVLKMTHIARGVDESGVLLVDVVLNGEIPPFSSSQDITIGEIIEDYVQIGPDAIYGTASLSLWANGHILPHTWNHTTFYDTAYGTMPHLVQHLHVTKVEVIPEEDKQRVKFSLHAKMTVGQLRATCPQGFSLDTSGAYCSDENECSVSDRCSHQCINSPGSYSCTCPQGFTISSNGHSCEDLNECYMGITVCPWEKQCANTVGSFECVAKCESGFLVSLDGTHCEDIDECEVDHLLCSQICLNTPGSFQCTCEHGYLLTNKSHCKDLNECSERMHNCFLDEECINTEGGYYCRLMCQRGYVTAINGSCIDIDECDNAAIACPPDKTCTNTVGSYHCQCPRGFHQLEADGQCLDVNECEKNECQHFCQNTYGAFHCNCPMGYRLDTNDRTCTDVNECEETTLPCSRQNACFNTRGSFRCIARQCPINYHFDENNGYCIFSCDDGKLHCPPDVKYKEIITHKVVALPSNVASFEDIIQLTAFDVNGQPLPYTTFSVLGTNEQYFQTRVQDGSGFLYTTTTLPENQDYSVSVIGLSYDNKALNLLYSTQFIVHVSVSQFPY